MSGTNHRWLIAAAVEQEIRGIRAGVGGVRPESGQHRNVWSGCWRGEPLLLVRTGVGPERATRGISSFLSTHAYRGIVSTGYAGGLRDGCRIGDILVPDEVQTIPPLPDIRIRPDPELREKVIQAVRPGPWEVHTGRMITTDRVIFSSSEKRRLGREYDAGSVEMESAVIAELAERASVPLVVVRVVLDEASFSLPDLMEVVRWFRRRQFGRLPDLMEVVRWFRRRQFGKLIQYVSLHPHSLFELLKLLQRTRRASKILTHLFLDYLLDGLVEVEQ
jgi:adenosylhomocysteine nucleosidase